MYLQNNHNQSPTFDTNNNMSITKVSANDVLCGRGSLCYHHPGSQLFRLMIRENISVFLGLQNEPFRQELLVSSVVQAIHHHGGRFLRKKCQRNDQDQTEWVEISDKEAFKKTSTAFRNEADQSHEASTVLPSDDELPRTNECTTNPSVAATPTRLLRTTIISPSSKTERQDLENFESMQDVTMGDKEKYASTTVTPQPTCHSPLPMEIEDEGVPNLVSDYDNSYDFLCPLNLDEYIMDASEFSSMCSSLLQHWGSATATNK